MHDGKVQGHPTKVFRRIGVPQGVYVLAGKKSVVKLLEKSGLACPGRNTFGLTVICN